VDARGDATVVEGAGAGDDVCVEGKIGEAVKEGSDKEGLRGGMDAEGSENEVNTFVFFFFWNSCVFIGVSMISATTHFFTEASMSFSFEVYWV
jgi:hypothetical protein